jgi:RNA polymerase-binding transcription factor
MARPRPAKRAANERAQPRPAKRPASLQPLPTPAKRPPALPPVPPAKRPTPLQVVRRPAASPAGVEPRDPEAARAEIKATLLEKRAGLIAKLREEREGRRDTGHREKIEGTPFGDRPGLSPDDEMGFAVADRRAEMLVQIDLALKKMEEGNYGRCEVCEQPINVVRLRVHPFAVRCTRCQEAWERDQSRGDLGAGRARANPEEGT